MSNLLLNLSSPTMRYRYTRHDHNQLVLVDGTEGLSIALNDCSWSTLEGRWYDDRCCCQREDDDAEQRSTGNDD